MRDIGALHHRLVTGFVVIGAVWMCVTGVRRSLQRQAERRAYEQEKWETEQRLRDENARLAQELSDRRRENRPARRPVRTACRAAS